MEKVKLRIYVPEMKKAYEIEVSRGESGKNVLDDVYSKNHSDFEKAGFKDTRQIMLICNNGKTILNRNHPISEYVGVTSKEAELTASSVQEHVRKNLYEPFNKSLAEKRARRAATA